MQFSELRIDPIVGRQVFIAEDRAGRPNDFLKLEQSERAAVDAVAVVGCPFCAGHEKQTLETSYAVHDARGDWQVRVVPNKFPAVTSHGEKVVTTGLPFKVQPAIGAQEVIIESPRHISDIIDLSLEEFTTVLLVFRDRLRHWADDRVTRHALIFKNVGYAAGASLEHAHSQVLALPFVPRTLGEELQGARRFYADHQRCVYCQLLQEEIRQGLRVVAEEGPFVALCAYAARQPYETWILPTQHAAHYGQLSEVHALSLAKLLQQLLFRLHALLPRLSYNLVLHTAPFEQNGDSAPNGDAVEPYYHWHWELIPRTTKLAGLEWGTGMHVNPMAPERAAAGLRGVRCEG